MQPATIWMFGDHARETEQSYKKQGVVIAGVIEHILLMVFVA